MLFTWKALIVAAISLAAIILAFTDIRRLADRRRNAEIDTNLHALLLRQNRQLRLEVERYRAEAASWTPKSDTATGSIDLSSPYAYVFYVTSDPYACSAMVNIHRLQEVLHVGYPIHVLASSHVHKKFVAAMRARNVQVHIQEPPPLPRNAPPYYRDSMLKLKAFELHMISPGLKRVLAFDADQLVLQNFDHLFEGLPNVDLAAPRAYWLAKDYLATTFLMINLSDRLWETMATALMRNAVDMLHFKLDMDLVNELLGDTVLMLGGEYVTLNSHWEDWDLPRWYHPYSELNMTTIEALNKFAKQVAKQGIGISHAASRLEEKREIDSSLIDDLPIISPPKSSRPIAAIPVHSASKSPHSTRFPLKHPLTTELYSMFNDTAVLHFTAVGKPWACTPEAVDNERPDAHPLLAGQMEMWREIAADVCPGGIAT